MKVLADTSIWVAHFKKPSPQMAALLNAGLVLCHPYVVIEVACGTPQDRRDVIESLRRLRSAPMASDREVLHFIEKRGLYGRGCGMVDICLLASALIVEDTRLWTLDKRLGQLAQEFGRAFA